MGQTVGPIARAILLLPFLLVPALAAEQPSLAGLTAALCPILYAGAISGGIAYTLQVVAQQYTPSSDSAIIMSAEALFAALDRSHTLYRESGRKLVVANFANILIGILAVTVASFFFAGNTFHGVVSMPPSLAPSLLQLDIMGALSVGILNVVLVFFLVELFDATGTLMGVANRAGLLKQGKMDRLNKALLADSTAIMAGSLLGTSSTTAYIESASGVQAGGRTGLTALTVAVLFLLCLFFSPLAGVVPAYATAPALLYVSCLMLRELVDLNWEDTTEAVPAVLTALMMPFTYSIANGVAFGFITYAGLKLFTGRMREVPIIVWIISAVFLFRFFYLSGGH